MISLLALIFYYSSPFTLMHCIYKTTGSEYTFFSAGVYGYDCGEEGRGNLSVVPGLYTITLCQDCESQRSQYRITTGDSIQWVLVQSPFTEEEEREVGEEMNGGCSMMSLMDERGVELLQSGTNYYCEWCITKICQSVFVYWPLILLCMHKYDYSCSALWKYITGDG